MRQLYERYKGYAMSIGLRYIAEVSDVEDVVQDSFVTILTSIGKFDYRGEGSLKGWIGRIVANKAFDFVKHHERMTFTDVIPDTQDEEPEIERIPPNVLTAMQVSKRMVVNRRFVIAGWCLVRQMFLLQ